MYNSVQPRGICNGDLDGDGVAVFEIGDNGGGLQKSWNDDVTCAMVRSDNEVTGNRDGVKMG